MDFEAPKILLVDDDDLSRRMMALLISDKGYNYDIASNGIEAVQAVKSHSYAVILMDLQMPIMDGFEAARKIRSLEAGKKHTPIVALTAMLFEDEIQKCMSAGMDDYISKPFNTEALFILIESYVNQSKQRTIGNRNHITNEREDVRILDVQEALPRFSKDIEFYRELLTEFIDDLPQRIELFRTDFLSGDYQALSDRAHNLKGISASLGAKQLSSLSQTLDQKSRDGNPVIIGQVLDELESHVSSLKEDALSILSGYIGQQKN